jgi:hypothetical protein
MDVAALERLIEEDKASSRIPLIVLADAGEKKKKYDKKPCVNSFVAIYFCVRRSRWQEKARVMNAWVCSLYL